MMNDQSLPPASVRDNANALFQLVSLLADNVAKELLGDLAQLAGEADAKIRKRPRRLLIFTLSGSKLKSSFIKRSRQTSTRFRLPATSTTSASPKRR